MMKNQLLSVNKSWILKGIAICLLLVHHLFYERNGLYNDFPVHGRYLVQQIGVFSRLCVALFVFLSGYGLAVSHKEQPIGKFYMRRFKKLFLNYWFIWIIFVGLSILVFHRSMYMVYGNHIAMRAGLDFLGILFDFGYYGYNPTWWFITCIISLYLLYPFLYKGLEKYPYLVFTAGVILPMFSFLTPIVPIAAYLLPFTMGMWMARRPAEEFTRIGYTELLVVLALLAMFHNFSNNAKFIVETMMCADIAVLAGKTEFGPRFEKIFVELGKHSMNIFLFHTFIFYYWFTDYIYITRNPVLIFLELLAVCWLISVCLERLKQVTGFNKLLAR